MNKAAIQKKRREQVLKQRMILSIAAFAIIISSSFAFTGFMTSAHDTSKTIPTKVSYESIQIESGDSLWTIAEEYKPAGQSVQDYINELVSLNSLKSTDIHADQYLTVSFHETTLM